MLWYLYTWGNCSKWAALWWKRNRQAFWADHGTGQLSSGWSIITVDFTISNVPFLGHVTVMIEGGGGGGGSGSQASSLHTQKFFLFSVPSFVAGLLCLISLYGWDTRSHWHMHVYRKMSISVQCAHRIYKIVPLTVVWLWTNQLCTVLNRRTCYVNNFFISSTFIY